mmetsp:Transcript_5048/g.6682  ORF Transcript_5048/g.6682 Transcript_5048/m.6682 type:complete len:171 (+) Transcript_5048:483-995(+)
MKDLIITRTELGWEFLRSFIKRHRKMQKSLDRNRRRSSSRRGELLKRFARATSQSPTDLFSGRNSPITKRRSSETRVVKNDRNSPRRKPAGSIKKGTSPTRSGAKYYQREAKEVNSPACASNGIEPLCEQQDIAFDHSVPGFMDSDIKFLANNTHLKRKKCCRCCSLGRG